jgi:peptidase inhibitor family I36
MRRTIALAVSVLSSVAVLTVASPAAHADNSACPADRFCLFEHDDFGGGRAVFRGTDTNLTNNFWEETNRQVHNNASSMINNTGRSVVLWNIDVGCRDDFYVAVRESEDRDLTSNGGANQGVDFDNLASCVVFN